MCAYFRVDKAINDSFLFQTKIKERIWQLRDFHFNNVFSAMLTLYTSATGEGWPRLVKERGGNQCFYMVFLHVRLNLSVSFKTSETKTTKLKRKLYY